MRKVGLGVLAAAAGIVPLASATPTLAQDAGVCAFTGASTQNNNAVEWVSGSGNFSFTGSANCVGTPAPHLFTGQALNSSGQFHSLVCGTSNPIGGAVTGNATLGTLGTGHFNANFVNGLAIASGTFSGSGSFSGVTGSTAGVIAIVPNNALLTGVFGGAPNQAENPTPVTALNGSPIFPNTTDPGLNTTSATCVDEYAVAGAFAVEG